MSEPKTTPTTGMATLRDGAQLAYQLYKGTGPGRIVLIHALAMSGAFWTEMVESLLPFGDVLTYDARGHGASSKTMGPYSIELFADDVANLLTHVGWPSASVAGASMGGCVALSFAGRHKARLDGLGLIDTTAWYGPDAPKQWEERAQKAVHDGMQALIEFQLTRWVSPAFREKNPPSLQAAIEVFLANPVKCYLETCRMLGRVDCRGMLGNVTAATTVMIGAEDYATPLSMAETLHQTIPGSSLHILPNVRHFTVLECPDLVAQHLSEIIARA